ncbi:MAG: copper amine oxidase N-terminal domain-containing protein [Clostridiales bacterium]|nr:copper amine oxidase N-terminal domain-containing protein [Clostridiales bacterium]
MKQRMQGFAAGIVIGAMAVGSAAYARSGSEWIEAVYSNIKLYVNDVQINTSENEPFIYNGSTYLPVRAVGEALGEPVSWDGNTKSVYIGKHGGTNLMYVCPPYSSSNLKAYPTSSGEYFTMSGSKYSNGFVFTHTMGSYALCNLNGKYQSMTLTLGMISEDYLYDEDFVVSFIVDNNVVATYTMNRNVMAQQITVPLNYGLQLKICTSENMDMKTGFANIVLQ